ncbi:MAG: TlpA family protein disulfide reductase [Acidobacteria bacterium]|nr:TlpA family protein disulfide reductase [Acidobacteriota bacterium]
MKTTKGFITILSVTLILGIAAFSQTLPSVGGGSVNLDAQRGKVVVLAVGASWLPLSARQVDITNSLAKKYQGRDIVFYFVATDSTRPGKNFASDEDVRKFAATNKIAVGSVLRDPDGGATFRKYSIDQVPSFIVIGKDGRMIGDPFGGLDSSPNSKYDITVPISRAIDKAL